MNQPSNLSSDMMVLEQLCLSFHGDRRIEWRSSCLYEEGGLPNSSEGKKLYQLIASGVALAGWTCLRFHEL